MTSPNAYDSLPFPRLEPSEALPVFITGLHKSGTTWLAKLLSHHPQIYVNYEAGFLDHQELLSGPNRILENQPDDASLEHEIRQLLDRWGGRPWNHWLDSLDRSEIEAATLRLTVQNLVGAAIRQFKPDAVAWADKTPRTAIRTIRRYFPEARVVYLMRDARDRAISLYYHCLRTEPWVIEAKEGLRRMKWDDLFRSWVDDISLNEPHFAHPSCCLVRYEDLLTRPDDEVHRLLTFLGVKTDSTLVSSLIAAASFERLTDGRQRGHEDSSSFFRKGISGDWQNFEAPEKLQPFWRFCLDTALRYGYDVEKP